MGRAPRQVRVDEPALDQMVLVHLDEDVERGAEEGLGVHVLVVAAGARDGRHRLVVEQLSSGPPAAVATPVLADLRQDID